MKLVLEVATVQVNSALTPKLPMTEPRISNRICVWSTIRGLWGSGERGRFLYDVILLALL